MMQSFSDRSYYTKDLKIGRDYQGRISIQPSRSQRCAKPREVFAISVARGLDCSSVLRPSKSGRQRMAPKRWSRLDSTTITGGGGAAYKYPSPPPPPPRVNNNINHSTFKHFSQSMSLTLPHRDPNRTNFCTKTRTTGNKQQQHHWKRQQQQQPLCSVVREMSRRPTGRYVGVHDW